MSTFYRVLYTREHFRSYRRGKVTSHHHRVIPPPWQTKWYDNGIRTFSDEDRFTVAGVFSTQALEAFLDIAPNRRTLADWTQAEIDRVSELEGLCAYATPIAAFTWGQYGPFAIMGKNRYIEFEGEYLCDDPDTERRREAIQARFSRWTSPLPRLQTAREFCDRHRLTWIAPKLDLG